MKDNVEVLRLRVLLCMLELTAEDSSVTRIAQILGEQKYTISRGMTALEEKGLVTRKGRELQLTKKGRELARRCAERMEVTINHLTYEGVGVENAKRDAHYWAIYNSEETMDILRTFSEQYRVKQELREKHCFNGSVLCKSLKDGQYRFPFVVYREQIKNGSNLSMANNGFEHPCTLVVRNGIGTIVLRAREMRGQSMKDGIQMLGRVKNLRYMVLGEYIRAENCGNMISIPADSLNFVNIGAGVGQILHGSVCLKMECTCGPLHMPESTAILTILI